MKSFKDFILEQAIWKDSLEELKDLKLKDERVWNNDRDIRMLCIKR